MTDSSKWKSVLDPVHGVIELDPLAVQIIDTREFQRLRSVKQLGCAEYVYPGATHTRFVHSIGVYYLACKMIEDLKRWTHDTNIKMDDWEEKCIRIAALCHDLGHGPFLHIYKEICQERPEQNWRWNHRDLSCLLVKRIFKTNESLRKQLKNGNASIRLIMRLIMGKKISDMSKDEKKKAYIYQIVSNEENSIDVDKWDYLCRDAMCCGMNERFFSERAILGARVVMTSREDESQVHQIGYPEKDALMFYNMFQTRYTLQRYIYKHRVIVAMNLMIKDIFKVSEVEFNTKGCRVFNFELYPMVETSKLPDNDKDLDTFIDSFTDEERKQTDKYIRLTDDIISRIRYINDKNGYSHGRPIVDAIKTLDRIDSRDFYWMYREIHLKCGTEYEAALQAKNECVQKLGQVDETFSESVAVELISFNYGMGEGNPMDKMIFYKKGDPVSGVIKGNTIPKRKVSHLLTDVFSDYYIRIYVKERDYTKTIEQTVEEMAKKYDTESEHEETSDPRGDDTASSDLQDEEELLEAIRNNHQKVEEMIRNQKIPKQGIMKVAMKQSGYAKGVKLALSEMSKQLRREISQAVGVWCGYKIDDPYTPVFVVTLKDQICTLKKKEVPEPFIDYEIIIRHKYVPNDEERSIVELYGNKHVRSEDVTIVNNCIAKHTERLMSEHSNLSIIKPCPVKAYNYSRKEMKVVDDICIVLYVPVKGLIPVGEKEFPKDIDGIVTDVREGEFLLFQGHNAMEYHQKLRIGCCIATEDKHGSLGGFVDLPSDKIGCLTAAHVVLTDDDITTYIGKGDDEKRNVNSCLAQGSPPIAIHQPRPLLGLRPFGRVHTLALEKGNIYTPSVDAAIIEITDEERKPETGRFPDGDFENIGFTKEDPMLYASGEILDDTETTQNESWVIKFGCTTGITQGILGCIEGSVRPVDVWGNYCFPVMFKQVEVQRNDFAKQGDSGALVFHCVGGNIRNLRAVGMVIGGTSTGCSCFITPIKAIFEKLGVTKNMFKVFPARQLPQPIERIDVQRNVQEHGEILNRLSEKIDTIEQRISRVGRVDALEEKVNSLEENVNRLNQDVREGFSNNTNNINERFNNILDILNQMNNRS